MKPLLPLALAVALLAVGAQAQNTELQDTPLTPTAAELAESNQQALQDARDLVRVDALWSKPLDFEELNSSTTDIAAHIKKALGPDAPEIEVRAKDTSRSTFSLKAAPLGPTLSSIATLNSYRVWVFAGRLLLAPEEALTTAEKGAVKEHWGGEWKSGLSSGRDWSSLAQLEHAAVPIVMADFKEHLAAKGVTAPPPAVPSPEVNETTQDMVARFRLRGRPPLPYSFPFTELSPLGQSLLKELVETNSRLSNSSGFKPKPAVLDETAIVSFDDTRSSRNELRLEAPFAQAPGGRRQLGSWFFNKPRRARAQSQLPQ